MSITLHHLENSRSHRIIWMLEELGLPYTIAHYERHPKTMRGPDSLKKIHPLGKSPMIEDDGHVLIETGAIVQHLVEKADGRLGVPAHRELAIRYRQFIHYAEGSMMPPLFALLIVGRLGILGYPARKPVQAMVDQHLDWLETVLGEAAYFAGDELTAADIMMSFPLEACQTRAGLDDSRPNIIAWLERIHARPAYKAAVAKTGRYDYA